MDDALCHSDELASVGIPSGWVTANLICHPDDILFRLMSPRWLNWGWYLIRMGYGNVILSSGWDILPFLSHTDDITNFNFSQHAVALQRFRISVLHHVRNNWLRFNGTALYKRIMSSPPYRAGFSSCDGSISFPQRVGVFSVLSEYQTPVDADCHPAQGPWHPSTHRATSHRGPPRPDRWHAECRHEKRTVRPGSRLCCHVAP